MRAPPTEIWMIKGLFRHVERARTIGLGGQESPQSSSEDMSEQLREARGEDLGRGATLWQGELV